MLLNQKDEKLIALLKDNARISVSELARNLGLSRTAAQMRLEKLERNGAIAGYTVRLSEKFEVSRVRAMVMIKSPPGKRYFIEQSLAKIAQLGTLHSISGTYDLVAIVSAGSVTDLDQLIDQIGRIEGVEDTMSSIILATKIDR